RRWLGRSGTFAREWNSDTHAGPTVARGGAVPNHPHSWAVFAGSWFGRTTGRWQGQQHDPSDQNNPTSHDGSSYDAHFLVLVGSNLSALASYNCSEPTKIGIAPSFTSDDITRIEGLSQTISLIGDDPGRLEAAETVQPESGRILVKDAEGIWRQGRPCPLEHLIFQLPWGPTGKSGKSPEGFGRFGLRNDAFQHTGCAPDIDPVEDRSHVRCRLLESREQEKTGWLDWSTLKQPMGGPLEHSDVR